MGVVDAGNQAYDDSWHWVLLESGSNQEFIFRSPRRRYSVGASGLLLDIPTWVSEASVGADVVTVISTSSKVLLLARTPEDGRQVVLKATESVLENAPGPDFWGVVEQEIPTEDGVPLPLMNRVADMHKLHAQQRFERATPHLRATLQPFSAVCSLTGVAASRMESTADGGPAVPVSEQAHRALKRAEKRHKTLTADWPLHTFDTKDEIDSDGWVAIVHADGNRVGQLITKIASVDVYQAVSQGLEDATRAALTDAMTATAGHQPKKPWILPLIVGGDDITVIVDAPYALAFAANYLAAFERHTAADPALSVLAQQALEYGHLTASAGVVACKGSTPFSLVYELVEEVTGVAKAAQDSAPGRSPLAFYKAIDAVPESLETQETASVPDQGVVRRRAGAYVAPSGVGQGDQAWETAHSIRTLLDAVAEVSGDEPPLSGSRLHDLRMALGRGELLRALLNRARADGAAASAFLDAHLVVKDGNELAFTRFLDLYDAPTLTGEGVLP